MISRLSGSSSTEPLRFSLHAQARLSKDPFPLDAAQIQRLQAGLEKASQKGAKESLFLMDDKAFIVNVPNKIVITSINQQRLKESVFTKIDSAVII